jgi:hypothetical protein
MTPRKVSSNYFQQKMRRISRIFIFLGVFAKNKARARLIISPETPSRQTPLKAGVTCPS